MRSKFLGGKVVVQSGFENVGVRRAYLGQQSVGGGVYSVQELVAPEQTSAGRSEPP